MYEALNIFYSQHEVRCRTITKKGSKNRNHRTWLRADIKETEKLIETIFEIALKSSDTKKKSLGDLKGSIFFSFRLFIRFKKYGVQTENKIKNIFEKSLNLFF